MIHLNTILIVEDEFPISQVIKAYLKKANFGVVQVFTGMEALETFREVNPDLVLLDVMLPGKSGWDILKEIRKESTCPIIMLTALGDINYKLEGLNSGADDYIPKPFEGDEVVARVKAVLRRSTKQNDSVKRYGKLEVDLQAHRVFLDGVEVMFTPRDLSLLMFLVENPNITFTREQLIDHVWGYDYEGSDRAVDLSIKRIRKALKEWPVSEGEIRTLRGLGYQLSVYKNET